MPKIAAAKVVVTSPGRNFVTLGSYTPIFLFCSVAYPLALLVVHPIDPRWAPVTNLVGPPPPLEPPLEPIDAR